jgi:hypothetical protein
VADAASSSRRAPAGYQLRAKGRLIERERVGAVVARGEAEIGFQQVGEKAATTLRFAACRF